MAKHHIEHHGAEHVEHHHHRHGGRESAIEREAHEEHESVAEERREHEGKAHGGAVMHNMGPGPEDEKHGGHVRRPRRARGGRTSPVQVYNAQGSKAVQSAEDESEDFMHGGRAKRKPGGVAGGHEARARGDRAHRGRHAKGGAVHHEHEHHGDGAAVHHHHHAEGHAVHHHGDGDIHMHRRHGGATREHHAKGGRAGGSPLSTGRNIKPPMDDAPGRGHEGVTAPPEPF